MHFWQDLSPEFLHYAQLWIWHSAHPPCPFEPKLFGQMQAVPSLLEIYGSVQMEQV